MTAPTPAFALRRMPMPQLRGRITLVTGAASGIGATIAQALHGAGATVIVSDHYETGAQALARRLGGKACARSLDVRDELAWAAAMAHALDAHGRLDVLVNAASMAGWALAGRHDPEHASLADWHAVHRTHLDGAFLGCKYALRTMRRARPAGVGGSIVNISARAGVAAVAAYASSQAAVSKHSRSVALYCTEQGLPVRCNAILTPTFLPHWSDPAPPSGAAWAEAVATIAVFLASDASASLTGAELKLHGNRQPRAAQTQAIPAASPPR